MDWLIGPLIDWLNDWSIDWLIDWSIDGLMDWLIDWSIKFVFFIGWIESNFLIDSILCECGKNVWLRHCITVFFWRNQCRAVTKKIPTPEPIFSRHRWGSEGQKVGLNRRDWQMLSSHHVSFAPPPPWTPKQRHSAVLTLIFGPGVLKSKKKPARKALTLAG